MSRELCPPAYPTSHTLWPALIVVLFLLSCNGHVPAPPIATRERAKLPAFKHVFIVVEENENYDEVIGNTADMPYLNQLAQNNGLATNFFADTHPSLNNYFVLTAGRLGTTRPWTGRFSDLFPGVVGGENVASVLADAGKDWKVYAESIPSRGYIGDDRFPYVKRHNPFAYFQTVRTSESQRNNIVPFDEFASDLQNNKLPAYSFLVPNVFDDAHNDPATSKSAECGNHRALRSADAWLRKNIDPLVHSENFKKDGLLIIVFDEACEYGPNKDWRLDPDRPKETGGGHIPAIVISSKTPPGTKSNVLCHHQSILRLSLRALGVEQLPGAASDAPDMDAFFEKGVEKK